MTYLGKNRRCKKLSTPTRPLPNEIKWKLDCSRQCIYLQPFNAFLQLIAWNNCLELEAN